MDLSIIKDNFVHELKQTRLEKQLTQAQMADHIGVSKRTYQRLEDRKDLECPFCSAIHNLSCYSSASSYNFRDWLLKMISPDTPPEERSLFNWESSLLASLKEIDQSIRRSFTNKPIEKNISKLEMITAISSILLGVKEKSIANILQYLQNEHNKDELPSEYRKKFEDKYFS